MSKSKPCDFENINDVSLRNELAALSHIGVAATRCVEIEPYSQPYIAFVNLVSLFCIVGERMNDISFIDEEDSQLDQTIESLNALREFDLQIDSEVLDRRIQVYVDASKKLACSELSEGNPVIAVVK